MKNYSVLEVNLNLLKKNCRTLKQMTGDSFFCPMIKANAYGHGAVPVAKALLDSDIKQVGVVNTNEAWFIKKAVNKMDVLIFGPILDKEDLSWIVENKVVVVCNNWQDLKQLSLCKKVVRIHLKFDTGFSRLGFDLKDLQDLDDFLKDHPQIRLEGLATQLVSGEEIGDKNSFSYQQLKKFFSLKKPFSGLHFHALNTSALISSFINDGESTGTRPGIGLYGIKASTFFKNQNAEKKWKDLSLPLVSCLKSTIVSLHHVPKGCGVSYDWTWKAKRPSQIATVFLGYGDGFLRGSKSSREVLFREKKKPIVGTVCMDFFMIDVTDCNKEKPIELGEEIILFGQQGKTVLSPQSQAESSGTSPYELFSRIGNRVKRIYIN